MVACLLLTLLLSGCKPEEETPSSDNPSSQNPASSLRKPENRVKPTGLYPGGDEAGVGFSGMDALPLMPMEETEDSTDFEYFAILNDLNPGLPFHVACYLSNTDISAVLPAGVDVSSLVVSYRFAGKELLHGDQPVISGQTALDFTQPVVLTAVAQDGTRRDIKVTIETLATGLPSVALSTENFTPIPDRTTYIPCTFYVGGGDDKVCDYAAAQPYLGTGQAKGRGHSSWEHPKKGFTIKLDQKARLLGMSESDEWCLIANYEDKTLLRNYLGFYLSEQIGLEYTPKARPVDLWYNGLYWGTYNLTEKIEIEKDRVNIAKFDPSLPPDQVGYIMEFDGHVNEVPRYQKNQWQPVGIAGIYDPITNENFFPISIGQKWLTVKKPSPQNITPEHMDYIYEKVYEAISALQDGDYQDIEAVLDVRSFVKWYIIEELMNNTDSAMHSSVYMTLDVGGKFKMGPVWDFDRSSGNSDYWNQQGAPDFLYKSKAGWFHLLFQHKEARDILWEEWQAFYPKLADLTERIEGWGDMLYRSQHWNFVKWDILDIDVGANPKSVVRANTYEKQLRLLTDYMASRAKALNTFYKRQAR